jgi:hypothetical protein
MQGRLKAQGRHRERAFRAEPWCKQDLFFMENTLRRGASFREVAGFLCRPEGEVRAKAIELGIHPAEEPCASRTKRPAAGIFLAEGKGPRMVSLDDFQNVYCPTCRRVQPARFDFLKADAYIDHDSVDIVCSECQSAIASLHGRLPLSVSISPGGRACDSGSSGVAYISTPTRRTRSCASACGPLI